MRFSSVFATDQLGILLTPFGGGFVTEGLGGDKLGQVVDTGQGGFETLFDLAGEAEESFDAVDDFAVVQVILAENFVVIGCVCRLILASIKV